MSDDNKIVLLKTAFASSRLARWVNAQFAHTEGEHASEPTTPQAGDKIAVYRPGEGKHYHAEVGGLGGGVGYDSYVADLLQSGTNAPSATVHDDGIGEIAWSRSSPGVYLGTLTGAFPAGRTWLSWRSFTIASNGNDQLAYVMLQRLSDDVIQLQAFDQDGPTNGDNIELLAIVPIEIRVYPAA